MKVILFDLGNVVFHCTPSLAIRSWADAAGCTFEVAKSKLDLDHATHHRFERGEVAEDEFRALVSQQLGYSLSVEEFRMGWNGIYGPEVEWIAGLLAELRLKYRLVALTNTNATHYSIWTDKYEEVLTNFEAVFSSHQIGHRKPGRGAYATCLKYADVDASDVVFLDDRAENVAGAEALGMHGILVRSFPQMQAELSTLLRR